MKKHLLKAVLCLSILAPVALTACSASPTAGAEREHNK